MADQKTTNNVFKYLIIMVTITLSINLLAVGLTWGSDGKLGSCANRGSTSVYEGDVQNMTIIDSALENLLASNTFIQWTQALENDTGIGENSSNLKLETSNENSGFFGFIDIWNPIKKFINVIKSVIQLMFPIVLITMANCLETNVFSSILSIWVAFEAVLILYLVLKWVGGKFNISN